MVTIPAIIEGISTRKDKTLKLTIATNETTPEQSAQLINLNQQFCYLAIKAELFNQGEIDAIDNLSTEFDNHKTPSQRLRGILYINWQQKPEGFKDFQSYYLNKMDRICEHYKSKIE